MTNEIIPQLTKICTKCKIEKELSLFPNRKDSKDGKRNDCINCRNIYNTTHYKANTEKILQYQKQYREDNNEKIKIYAKKYREDNREKINEQSREYYKNNAEKANRQSREYYAKNRIERNNQSRKYYKNNIENIKQLKKIYYKKNHDKITKYKKKYYKKNANKIYNKTKEYRNTEIGRLVKIRSENKRRYLKKHLSDGTIPGELSYPLTVELQELLEKQDYRCNNCQCDISDKKHLDHHVPLSKGGTHSINNVVWLCPKCNLSKSNKMPDTLLLV